MHEREECDNVNRSGSGCLGLCACSVFIPEFLRREVSNDAKTEKNLVAFYRVCHFRTADNWQSQA